MVGRIGYRYRTSLKGNPPFFLICSPKMTAARFLPGIPNLNPFLVASRRESGSGTKEGEDALRTCQVDNLGG